MNLGGLYLGLDEVRDIHGHLIDLGIVKLLYVFQCTLVLASDEVYGYSLSAESTATTNPVWRGREGEREREGGRARERGREEREGERRREGVQIAAFLSQALSDTVTSFTSSLPLSQYISLLFS